MHMDDEIFEEVAVAVFAGDLSRAESLLGELQIVGSEAISETVRRAKRKARPELKVDLPPATPFKLPVPGHLPFSTLGAPRLSEDDAIPPGAVRESAQNAIG